MKSLLFRIRTLEVWGKQMTKRDTLRANLDHRKSCLTGIYEAEGKDVDRSPLTVDR